MKYKLTSLLATLFISSVVLFFLSIYYYGLYEEKYFPMGMIPPTIWESEYALGAYLGVASGLMMLHIFFIVLVFVYLCGDKAK